MITRLGNTFFGVSHLSGIGDLAVDEANAMNEMYGNPFGTQAQLAPPPTDVGFTAQQIQDLYNSANAASTDLTSGIRPASDYTITPTGVVQTGGGISSFLSNLFGGSPNFAAPGKVSPLPASQVGVTTFTNPLTGNLTSFSTSTLMMGGVIIGGFVLLNSMLKRRGR